MKLKISVKWVFFPALLCCVMAGCSLGPKALKGNRLDYNVNIQKSNNEELLINLVRAKYYEQLFFLQVGSISSSFSYSANAVMSGTFYKNGGAAFANSFTPLVGAGYDEKPTITYTPVQGEQALKQLMEEISLDRFMLLIRSGWSIQSLMWSIVRQIGELNNFAPEMTRGVENNYHKFLDLVRMFGRMQSRGDLEFVGVDKEGNGIMQLRYAGPEEADEIEHLLCIKPERIQGPRGKIVSTIKLTQVRELDICCKRKDLCNKVPIKLKSCFEVLYDLGRNVEVPEKDMERGLTQKYETPRGELINRKGLHHGLIAVRSSTTRPEDAYATIFYRDRWYYIADDDARSKAYFVLAETIISLQAGDLKTEQPLLTLPVN